MLKEIKWKYEIGQHIKDDRRNLFIIDRKIVVLSNKKTKKYYKYLCSNCKFNCGEHYRKGEYKEEHWIEESKLQQGQGCSCCSAQIVVRSINDFATINPHLIKYFKNTEDTYKYSIFSHKKIIYKCPDCGYEKEIVIKDFYMQGFSCKKCGDGVSYPNKFMFNMLFQLKLDFTTEYSPNWITPKRYDFYIPSMKLIVEMDGKWHSKDNQINGQTADESKSIDNYKDNLAKEYGIYIIRIDCDYGKIENRFEYIKNNIISNKILNKLFDLNNVNWNSCENLVKEVCDYWRTHNNINNENIDTLLLSNIYKLSIGTISRYLNQGTKLKWCNYNGKEEIKKKTIKSNSIPIEIFKDGISLGVFLNAREICREYEKLGIKLSHGHISNVASGKRKSHKGFTFKYVNPNKR